MTGPRNHILLESIAAIFIFLFAYTALSKLSAMGVFQAVLRQAPLIGRWHRLISWVIPISELTIALLLIFPFSRDTGIYFAFIIMAIFTTYVGCMLIFAVHLPCSCGGVISEMSWKQHLLFNIFLTSLALSAVKLLNRSKKEQRAHHVVFT